MSTREPKPPADPEKADEFVALDPKWVSKSTVRVLLLVAGFMIALWAFSKLSDFLFLLLLAWLLGIAMDPIVSWMEKKGIKRGVGTLLTILAFIVGTLIFFAAFGGLLVTQLAQLVVAAPDFLDALIAWANRTFGVQIDTNQIASALNLTPQKAAQYGTQLAGGLLGILGSTLGIIFQGFTLLLFAFYFAAEGPRLRRKIASWLPPKQQIVFTSVWNIAVAKTGGFVISRLALAALCSVLTSLFLLIIGVPYWLPLGIWVGVVSQFIPTVGTYLGIALPVLVALMSDQPLDAVWVIVFATVYQQIENYFFAPRISSSTMDIHPAVAFASVIIGASLFGPLGALIGIPLAAAIIAIWDTYANRYELIPELAAPGDNGSSTQAGALPVVEGNDGGAPADGAAAAGSLTGSTESGKSGESGKGTWKFGLKRS